MGLLSSLNIDCSMLQPIDSTVKELKIIRHDYKLKRAANVIFIPHQLFPQQLLINLLIDVVLTAPSRTSRWEPLSSHPGRE
jgi:hypothetical protein